jgi:hypothetical protein
MVALKESAELAKADQHIRSGLGFISRQQAVISGLKSIGADTTEAESLLDSFQDIMRSWLRHRDLILATIQSAK